jgi:hypothetical protein
MLYIILRGYWCNIIVLNVHAPSEEKSDDSKNSIYEELGQVFDHFPTYHKETLLGDLKVKVEGENIFKPTIGNESPHQDNKDNGVRTVNFAATKSLVVTNRMFPHRNIQ